MGDRIEDCSCPRGGGWRPGARWSRREETQARIDALPAHQRPPIRELGRRSEPAEVPFRGGPSAPSQNPLPCGEATAEAMVTVHRCDQRMTLAAVSPEARAIGLYPEMALTQARAMVPGLDIRQADPAGDAAFLTGLAAFAARRWTPRAAVSDPTGLWLDLSGVAHLFGGEAAMCRRIVGFCARLGYAARIAVAGTPGAAHALARHGHDAVTLCPAGGEAGALSPLPLSALRLDDKVLGAARRLGVERIGELIAMPRAPLTRRFGKTLLACLDRALGRTGEPFDPVIPEEPPSATLRLLEPIVTAEAIEQVLGDLMTRLTGTLQLLGLAPRTLTLLCDRVDGEQQRISIGTARATRDGPHLLHLLGGKIETIEPGFGIEAMHLVAGRCQPLGPQAMAGELAGAPPVPDLAPLVDRLAMRLGPRRVFRLDAVESDVPERSVRRAVPLDEVREGPRCWPRPARLFSPPEPVEKVMAELPDLPPIRFSWRGRMHLVRKADGPERIYGEWWKRTGEADAVRDYFQVEDAEGARFWLYRRGDGEDSRTGDMSWWLQGAFG